MLVDICAAVEPHCVRFRIVADASPGILPRLLQPFARRDLFPDRLSSRRGGGSVIIEVDLSGVGSDTTRLLEGNLRQVVGVRSVGSDRQAASVAA